MYKITIKPGVDSTTKIVSVSTKKTFLNIGYWNTLEHVLCNNRYLEYHVDHFTSKYAIISKNKFSQTVKVQQKLKTDIQKNTTYKVNENATSLVAV